MGVFDTFNLDFIRDKLSRNEKSQPYTEDHTQPLSPDESPLGMGLPGSTSRMSEPAKQGFVKRQVNEWSNRLLGAVSDGGFSKQEAEYDTHRTSQDYIWNTAGMASWGMVFPLLTIIVTQLCGAEDAGRFSLAFVVGTVLMIVANYGVRTYQVSDVAQQHSFAEYQVNRWITCLIMMVVGFVYCNIRGYADTMWTMTMFVLTYKMIDGLADVYEGRLQQMDKLYLAGISQTIRSVAAFVVFTVVLLVTRNLGIASIAMAIVAIASFVLVTFPLALLETPRSSGFSLTSMGGLFAQCFPMFLSLFLYAFIDNMPKFMMEGMLSYDNQLYFNALYFPAMAILLTVQFIYRPLLVRMSEAWNDLDRRRRFDLFIIVALLLIAIFTGVVVGVMSSIGIPIMSFLYGIDFEQFRNLCYLMVIAGGVTGGIDFLYQVMTVMRRQAIVTKLYLITFVFALFIPYMLIRISGLRGAVIGYLIVMAVLLVLLLLEYISVRVGYRNHPEDDPTYEAAVAASQRKGVSQDMPDASENDAQEGGWEEDGLAEDGRQPQEQATQRVDLAAVPRAAAGQGVRARSEQSYSRRSADPGLSPESGEGRRRAVVPTQRRSDAQGGETAIPRPAPVRHEYAHDDPSLTQPMRQGGAGWDAPIDGASTDPGDTAAFSTERGGW